MCPVPCVSGVSHPEPGSVSRDLTLFLLPPLCNESYLHVTHKALLTSFSNTAGVCSCHTWLVKWLYDEGRQMNTYVTSLQALAINTGSAWQMLVPFRHMLPSHFLQLPWFRFSFQLQ